MNDWLGIGFISALMILVVICFGSLYLLEQRQIEKDLQDGGEA